ncbi:MAG TPA: hypothetical protein VGB14_02565 [Acidimicrobiales bacterium]|jgi:hypothetical protein
MGEATAPPGNGGNDATGHARRTALDPTLPSWAREVVGLLLDGDAPTLDLLETLATEAAVLFDRGRRWLTE